MPGKENAPPKSKKQWSVPPITPGINQYVPQNNNNDERLMKLEQAMIEVQRQLSNIQQHIINKAENSRPPEGAPTGEIG